MLANTRNVLQFPVLMLMAGSMSACSWLGIGGEDGWLRDREGEYLEARIMPPMQIPPGLDSFTIDELYHIPELPPGDRAIYVTPPAPKPIDTRIREGVVVQRFGDRAWIVIGATAGQVWPTLRDYWSAEDVAIVMENPVQGVLETAWLPQSGTNLRHKYRVQLEPGLHAGNSEIYVRHISDTGESPESMPISWPAESQNLERETAILASISLYLADRTDIYRASSVSMLAGSIELQGKARLIDAGPNNTQIELRLDFERAWSQMTQAINNANIEIVDSAREERRINVAFTGTENQEDPGFFGRLFGRGNDEVTRIDFIVRLIENGDRISVQAETLSGESAPYEQDLLIRTINDNLI
ncbi:outer membrane protein assembly factor BamC [Gammaproteobacteria bacterium LSUCC0112]|nr:outer membrane protein assembly factor BamC [Gammaproteobacteria bacterium LSUCC0112]